MLRISIVEDDQEQAAALEAHIKRYAKEHAISVSVSIFYNSIVFIEKYKSDQDIVFLDIMMPFMNGMDVAKAVRHRDEKVLIVFVTSMLQYAIQGYEVSASDYIVKPVTYPEFSLKFTRLLTLLPQEQNQDIILKSEVGYVRLHPDQILYVEVSAHHCIYHTVTGDFRHYQSMKSVEASLAGKGFARASNYLLLNLLHVTKVEGMSVHLGNTVCTMSHPRKKSFIEALHAYSETLIHDESDL